MAAARFLVSGKVQGVFFRASTRERAFDLGLSGRATNLADGRVEVIAQGDATALDALEAWLRLGPPAACVESVVRDAWTGPVNDGFVTG
ncbi:acylphosphatase [Pseudoxanthomonas sp. 3HH-4]|uniref:acylphosphatase n=1 Tax=Pseudoxanthomonas sp. 3HH-4 TaxID=1690214 RepID=UPI001153F483|nr:acylphosphatase [Pseudoxanthomonas sp. 3HH-4]TQM06957.1 acylphosphatase [Pseudoxanthomonas sp. 3HH-4]